MGRPPNRMRQAEGGMVTIETDRMVLRLFRDDDLDAYVAMNSHPEVWRYLSADGPPSREEAWRSMAMLFSIYGVDRP